MKYYLRSKFKNSIICYKTAKSVHTFDALKFPLHDGILDILCHIHLVLVVAKPIIFIKSLTFSSCILRLEF